MLIDSHCHLPHEKYTETVADIILDAKNNGVTKIISIGTSIKENENVIEVAKEFTEVYCTVGIYPHEDINISLSEAKTKIQNQIEKGGTKVIGVGECGIDLGGHEPLRSLENQIELFELQIELGLKNNLPIILHNRNADEQTLKVLSKYKDTNLRGVAHCFVGDWELAKKFLELNFYISFSGIITYPSGSEILETVKKVPIERFLIETDAPYLAPQSHRGEINKPKYVKIVAEKIASTRGASLEWVAKQTAENVQDLFRQ